MPCTTTIQPIQRTEAIGNSRYTINANFVELQEGVCENYSQIENIKTDITNLTTVLASISSQLIFGAAKAWVKFNGTLDVNDNLSVLASDTTDRKIRSSYGVRSVLRKSIGSYRVYFTNPSPFTSSRYVVVGTCNETAATNGTYCWVQPTRYDPSFVDINIHSSLFSATADPTHVSLVAY